MGSGGPAAGLFCLLRAGAPPSWAGLPASGMTPQRLRFVMCAVAGPRSKVPRQPLGAVMVLACLARPAPRGHLSRGRPLLGRSFHFVPPRGYVTRSRLLSIARPLLRSVRQARATSACAGGRPPAPLSGLPFRSATGTASGPCGQLSTAP